MPARHQPVRSAAMKIDLAAAARIIPLTALMLGACVSQSAYEQQGQQPQERASRRRRVRRPRQEPPHRDRAGGPRRLTPQTPRHMSDGVFVIPAEIQLCKRSASFETALRSLLRMRDFLNAIEGFPHAEERPPGASRSTQQRDCSPFSPTLFAGMTRSSETHHHGGYV